MIYSQGLFWGLLEVIDYSYLELDNTHKGHNLCKNVAWVSGVSHQTIGHIIHEDEKSSEAASRAKPRE
jgi:hypothetical protein